MVLEVANKLKNQIDGVGTRRNQGFMSSYEQKWRGANEKGAMASRAERREKE